MAAAACIRNNSWMTSPPRTSSDGQQPVAEPVWERLVAAVLRRLLRALLLPTFRAGRPIAQQRVRLERILRLTLPPAASITAPRPSAVSRTSAPFRVRWCRSAAVAMRRRTGWCCTCMAAPIAWVRRKRIVPLRAGLPDARMRRSSRWIKAGTRASLSGSAGRRGGGLPRLDRCRIRTTPHHARRRFSGRRTGCRHGCSFARTGPGISCGPGALVALGRSCPQAR